MRLQVTFPLLTLVFTLILAACKPDHNKQDQVVSETMWKPGEYKKIDAATAVAMIDAIPELVVIDVRSPAEIQQGKIKDALEMNVLDADFGDRIAKLDKDKPYLVYCVSGGRSEEASRLMQQQDFTAVYNLVEGYGGYLRAQEK